MKYIEKYNDLGLHSMDEVFNYLTGSLKNTIKSYDFFVAWEKVLGNVAKIEIALNILNSLIGKDDIESRLKMLLKQYPEIVAVIPLLIAVRGEIIKIASIGGDIEFSFAKNNNFTDEEIDKMVFFVEKCGLLKMLKDKTIKNLVDYVIGVEVGLDTNARKNRSGTAMESLVDIYIKEICKKYNYKYLQQATAKKIKTEFGKEVVTDKANRHFDFAVDTGSKLYLIEVNYYSAGGSKLKSVAGEFKNLYNLVKNDTTSFVWITDGEGWLTAKRPLYETYHATDFVMNIDMIENGLLEEVFNKKL